MGYTALIPISHAALFKIKGGWGGGNKVHTLYKTMDNERENTKQWAIFPVVLSSFPFPSRRENYVIALAVHSLEIDVFR